MCFIFVSDMGGNYRNTDPTEHYYALPREKKK